MEELMKELKLIRMDEVEAVNVNFLWYPYIPFGKLTVIQGDPGEGKTTAVLQIAAALTRGDKLPCDEADREPMDVIYQTAEDGLADTVKPRLEAAGADCSRVHVIDESEKGLSMLDERLETAIVMTNAKLVILDPIQAYLGSGVDMHRANEIRPVMKHLGDIAEKYGCAIILIGHMNKASGSKSTYRGLGSIDIQATARSVLIVARVKDDPDCRVIGHDKSSLAPEGKSIAFRLSEETGFAWEGEIELTVDELLNGESKLGKLDEAKSFLYEILNDGPMYSTEIIAKAVEAGFKERTLYSAKKKLNISSVKEGDRWKWLL
mgnify:CR=1 FL=1